MTGIRTRSTAQRGTWGERALLPDRVGMPWWAAAFCALALAGVGAFADLERLNRLGVVFEVCYFLGCLLAVVVVQRKGLFGPMVQPPLILAVTVPGIILAIGSHPTGGGMVATALAVGTPLINGFPIMAITTGFTLVVGVLRLITERRPTSRHDL
ncbi:MAG: hypothetical protein DLM60_19710 [Pseudonocardiales bacterium]|nr:hypothetical protein [Actinomycetota bacterium]PZS14105.1 MAG: hypothetical protein DLM60_19710 [Pseudonocardiales bacterium]